MGAAPPVKWTREHYLIALNLYCKIPFGRLHKNNPQIKEVASRLGRTASSLAMKLANFASLDPVLTAKGIKGLAGASKQDRSMWEEFHSHLATLGPDSEILLHDLFTRDSAREVDFLQSDRVRLEIPSSETEFEATVRVRRGQQFFRQSVLTAYGTRCCISGIGLPRLLVASHIKPWRDFPAERLDPQNGICLSSIHDAAFDSGLMTLDDQFRVMLSKRLKGHLPDPALETWFVRYEGQKISLPTKLLAPNASFLKYHREELFEG